MKKCSMLKKMESLKAHESSRSDGAKFYDNFVESRAREILEDYDVNDAQGGDAWYGIGNGVEDMERDHRDGFISYNDGGLEKTWTTTSWNIVGQGCQDAKIEKDYDYLQEQCEDVYRDYCEKNGMDCDLQSEDFYEFEADWWQEGSDIFAQVEVMLYSRDAYKGRYKLYGRVSRNFDYTYGRGNYDEDDLSVEMELTAEQLTEANATKFLDEFEKQLKSYTFKDGKKTINVEAE